LPANRVLYRDGVPVGAIVSGKPRVLGEQDADAQNAVRWHLVKRGFDRPEAAAFVSK
jgi:ATP-dependent Lhr-like helicase